MVRWLQIVALVDADFGVGDVLCLVFYSLFLSNDERKIIYRMSRKRKSNENIDTFSTFPRTESNVSVFIRQMRNVPRKFCA